MKNKSIIPILIIFTFTNILIFSESKEKELYEKIINANKKTNTTKIADELGKLKTEQAEEYLFQFYDRFKENTSDLKYFYASIEGLKYFPSIKSATLFIKAYQKANMWGGTPGIIKTLNYDFESFLPFIKQIYSEGENRSLNRDRQTILKILARSGNKNGIDFIKQVILDKNDYYSDEALNLLIVKYPDKEKKFILSLLEDKHFSNRVLMYITENGSSKDLPLFLEILKKSKDESELTSSYYAVDKWGKDDLKKNTYYNALASQNEELIINAMFIFDKLKSYEIMLGLCNVIKTSKYQVNRIQAALLLSDYAWKKKYTKNPEYRDNIIPALIPVLKEEYKKSSSYFDRSLQYNSKTVVEYIYLNKYKSAKRGFKNPKDFFEEDMKTITYGLNLFTDNWSPDTYDEWKNWAESHGYIISDN